jgi:hypothetical protein
MNRTIYHKMFLETLSQLEINTIHMINLHQIRILIILRLKLKTTPMIIYKLYIINKSKSSS